MRVCDDEDAVAVGAMCRDFGIRCIIDIDPTRPPDTSAIDDALRPPELRRPARASRKKGET